MRTMHDRTGVGGTVRVRSTLTRHVAVAVAAFVTALTLAACGSGSDEAEISPGGPGHTQPSRLQDEKDLVSLKRGVSGASMGDRGGATNPGSPCAPSR
jgi:hypothetical protein